MRQSQLEEHRILEAVTQQLRSGDANDVMGEQLIDGHDAHLVREGEHNLTITDGQCPSSAIA